MTFYSAHMAVVTTIVCSAMHYDSVRSATRAHGVAGERTEGRPLVYSWKRDVRASLPLEIGIVDARPDVLKHMVSHRYARGTMLIPHQKAVECRS